MSSRAEPEHAIDFPGARALQLLFLSTLSTSHTMISTFIASYRLHRGTIMLFDNDEEQTTETENFNFYPFRNKVKREVPYLNRNEGKTTKKVGLYFVRRHTFVRLCTLPPLI